MRLLHMTHRAAEILTQLNAGPWGMPSPPLPPLLQAACHEIFRLLRNRTVAKDWEQFEVKHVIHGHTPPIVIRAFGVPDPLGWAFTRIVIILETGVGSERHEPENIDETFHFTPREKAVLNGLSKGWTNKEIALSLNMSLPTVKGHIKHIMKKTSSTTRTEILVKLMRKAG
jgi:DNA-binding CsgD family transcriptional regulator